MYHDSFLKSVTIYLDINYFYLIKDIIVSNTLIINSYYGIIRKLRNDLN